MPCYYPLNAFHAPGGISFDRSQSFGLEVKLPCGRCIGCRLEKSKSWALRCYHEALINGPNNSYITLTYNDENLPAHGCLNKSDFQKFIKRLRKNTHQKIRYYMCGEYGDGTNRPHYHALLFGYTPPDLIYKGERKGNKFFGSEELTKTWGLGHIEHGGQVSFKSAGYVARYIIKKQSTSTAMQNRYLYKSPDFDQTGELLVRPFEYTNMSLGRKCPTCKKQSCKNTTGGIGYEFYKTYPDSLFPHDYANLPDGGKMPVPTYYRNLLKRDDPRLYDSLHSLRIAKGKASPNNTPERLIIRERNALKHNKEQQPRDFL